MYVLSVMNYTCSFRMRNRVEEVHEAGSAEEFGDEERSKAL